MEHREVIKRLGGHQEIAKVLGYRPNRVLKWKLRNSIPPSVWATFVSLDFDVTLDELASGCPFSAPKDRV